MYWHLSVNKQFPKSKYSKQNKFIELLSKYAVHISILLYMFIKYLNCIQLIF